jgi:hypothetical protein
MCKNILNNTVLKSQYSTINTDFVLVKEMHKTLFLGNVFEFQFTQSFIQSLARSRRSCSYSLPQDSRTAVVSVLFRQRFPAPLSCDLFIPQDVTVGNNDTFISGTTLTTPNSFFCQMY